jgi:hypothetical protein
MHTPARIEVIGKMQRARMIVHSQDVHKSAWVAISIESNAINKVHIAASRAKIEVGIMKGSLFSRAQKTQTLPP